eukprot:TRINITY_DN27061_c0_g1_i1.p1 TRINITY_DN27061_c0_g1~~TRINITY_DN27061_c0_g1_i1.p1  ORF type:complete len:547 (+),score=117.06 TRINITY_DN27061_c0_g1_i1:319-1959(+)
MGKTALEADDGRKAAEIEKMRSRVDKLEEIALTINTNRPQSEPPQLDGLKQKMQEFMRELATVRGQHEESVSSFGNLIQLVAKTAAAGIQRSEERLSADFVGKKEILQQLEQQTKDVLAQVRSMAVHIGPTKALSDKSSEAGGENVESALRRIDLVAKELRADQLTQLDAADAKIQAAQTAFSADFQRLRGMLSTCVQQQEWIQVELSQLELERLGPRVAIVEGKVDQLGASMGMAALASPATATTPKSQVPERKDALDTSSGTSGGMRFKLDEMKTFNVRGGVSDKLQGIASSVQQIIMGAEDATEAGTTASEISSHAGWRQPPSNDSAASANSGKLSALLSELAETRQRAAGVMSAAERRTGQSADPVFRGPGSRALSPNLDSIGRSRDGEASGMAGLSNLVSGLSRGSVNVAVGGSRKGPQTVPNSMGPSRERSPSIAKPLDPNRIAANRRDDLNKTQPVSRVGAPAPASTSAGQAQRGPHGQMQSPQPLQRPVLGQPQSQLQHQFQGRAGSAQMQPGQFRGQQPGQSIGRPSYPGHGGQQFR